VSADENRLAVAELEFLMASVSDIQFVSDADGKPVSVIVPIELWREIESEKETAYLLKSSTMKQRLLEAIGRSRGLTLEDARAKLGI
jgi:PHD/YefM family antitoxin component YafN of YafNO toxin-antitoxin module